MRMMRALFFIGLAAIAANQDIQIVPSEGVKDQPVSEDARRVGSGSSGPAFKATHQWQEIPEGVHVPSGLHYRLNMETGKREAKKLSKAGDEPIDIKEVAKALKDLGDKGPPPESEAAAAKRKAKADSFRSESRPLSALKAAFDEAELALLSDSEIIRTLLTEYRKDNSTPERRLAILTDLEYYVHQIDNAVALVERGGLPLLKTALNSSDPELRQTAAFVLGSAAQSNPAVQIAMAEHGILHALCSAYPGEGSPLVRKKLVFALSALLRNFPFAQRKFLALGGPDIFASAFRSTDAAGVSGREKVKIVTLLFDLIREREIAAEHGDEGAVRTREEKESSRLYENVEVVERMSSSGWCERVWSLLAQPDWDSQEKVLDAMRLLSGACRRDFADARPQLLRLRGQYAAELAAEEDNDYLQGLLDTLDSVLARTPTQEEL